MAVEVMPDHVHLLVEVNPPYGVRKLVRAIKGHTPLVRREEIPSLRFGLPTLWANPYFMATTGGPPLAAVKPYVEQQEGR